MASTMTPYFGIVVSLIAYGIGTLLFKHSKGFFLFTPLFVAMVLGIVFLKVGNFTFEEYNTGGKMISFFLEPATIAFAIPLYKQVDKLKNIGGKFYRLLWLDLFVQWLLCTLSQKQLV